MRTLSAAVLLLLTLLASPALRARSADSAAANPTVYVIPVTGDVEPAMAAFIGRAVREATAEPDALAILEMDTFGGRVDAAFQIVDTLLQFPKERVVAYVKNKAISAGALIALACGSLYMREGTTLGDCAPITYSDEGPRMLGEKFQSPLRAKFRSLAKRNGFPETLAESMISEDMIVYELEFRDTVRYVDSLGYTDLPASVKNSIVSRTTVVARGELLTMDDAEAEMLGFSAATLPSVSDVARAEGLEEFTVERIEPNWSEALVRYITMFSPILMLIGLAGVYIETRTPGVGIPGIVGAVCLGLVFFGQYLVGLANYTELLLVVLGIILLLADVFVIPGFGVAGVAGILLIAAALVLSMQGFVVPQPEFPWQYDLLMRNLRRIGFSLVGATVTVILFFLYAFPHIGRIISGPTLAQTVSSHVDTDRPAPVKVGAHGVVVKPLRPSGFVRFGDVECNVVSDGDFLGVDERVTVTAIEGNRIVVMRNEVSNA